MIIIHNKSDISDCLSDDLFLEHPFIKLSAKTGDGLDDLTSLIETMFNLGEISARDSNAITNLRHKEALTKAYNSISSAIEALGDSIPYDIVSIDLTDCATHLGEITGKTVSDEIVDKIFARFCLGK